MADFEPIMTQEDFDARIKDRIARAEKSAAAKYADYDGIRKELDDLKAKIPSYQQSIDDGNAKIKTLEDQLNESQKKIGTYETDALKTRIAIEMNLPLDLRSRLNGTTEEEIRKDAEAFSSIIGKNQPTVPLARESAITQADDKENGLRKMLEDMKG